jgi:hypothetical protein
MPEPLDRRLGSMRLPAVFLLFLIVFMFVPSTS